MKLQNILKWSIIAVLLGVAVAVIIIISVDDPDWFNYVFIILGTLATILAVLYIFKQKEDSMPLDEPKSEEDESDEQK